MKGDITLSILEHIKDKTEDGVSLLRAFLTCGYGASLNTIYNKAYKEDILNIKKELSKEEWKKINNRFLSMISRLEKDGLVEKSGMKSNYFFKITKKGKEKRNTLRRLKKNALPKNIFSKNISNRFSMVIFDIPEKDKRKRDWLRVSLVSMGFEMVQKSVWMGKVKVSKEFIKALEDLNIINFIEIFQITKTGSLKSLK